MSWAVSRTWPTGMPWGAKAASYCHMRAAWPTAAVACFSGIERGRSVNRRRAVPGTMAPEVTSTTSRPRRTAATSPARAAMRTGAEHGRVEAELLVDDPQIVEGIPPAPGIEVEQVQEQPRPLGMPQELVAEPPPLGGPRDQPGQVGDHERSRVVHPHDAQRGDQRGERVLGDLRAGRAQPADQRGLA